MKTDPPRVLLLAEMANPNWVSVPKVGWWNIEAISAFADIHVVTHQRNQQDILGTGFPEERVTFIEAPPFEKAMHSVADRLSQEGAMGGGVIHQATGLPAYYAFELLAWRLFKNDLMMRRYDLVHRVTPVSPVMPSLFARRLSKLSIPFVVGPLNGGLPWPRGFLQEQRREGGRLVRKVRQLHRLLPYHRSMLKRSTALIAGSAVVWKQIPKRHHKKTVYMVENAIDTGRFSTTTQSYGQKPMPVAFVGRLVSYKGAEMLLEASAELLRRGDMKLDIIGEGPERPMLQALIEDRGLTQSVTMDGWVPFEELPRRLAQSAVFAFPSVREFGGAVVMEAMALGLVPVVVDFGGPAELVTQQTGFRIPVGSKQQIIAQLKQRLQQLVESPPEQLEKRGQRARQHILDNYSLGAKQEKIHSIYRWVMGQAGRPDLSPPSRCIDLY